MRIHKNKNFIYQRDAEEIKHARDNKRYHKGYKKIIVHAWFCLFHMFFFFLLWYGTTTRVI